MTNVFEAMRKRRMHRSFTDELVSEDVLAQLMRAATLAPMGGNELVRRIVIVTDPRLVKTVRQVTPSFLANAVAIVVVCTDLDRAEASLGRQGREILSLLSAGASAENVALAAPGRDAGRPRTYCKENTMRRTRYAQDGPCGLGPVEKVLFALDELVAVLGRTGTARRLGISYHCLWAWLSRRRTNMHKEMAARVLRSLWELRNEARVAAEHPVRFS